VGGWGSWAWYPLHHIHFICLKNWVRNIFNGFCKVGCICMIAKWLLLQVMPSCYTKCGHYPLLKKHGRTTPFIGLCYLIDKCHIASYQFTNSCKFLKWKTNLVGSLSDLIPDTGVTSFVPYPHCLGLHVLPCHKDFLVYSTTALWFFIAPCWAVTIWSNLEAPQSEIFSQG
jgi:hypothetical protein